MGENLDVGSTFSSGHSLGHNDPYERRTNDFLTVKSWSQIPLRTPYERLVNHFVNGQKNRSYGVRKGM